MNYHRIAISITVLFVLTATTEARHFNIPTLLQRKNARPPSSTTKNPIRKKPKPPKPTKPCSSCHGGGGDAGGGGDDNACFPSSAKVTLSSLEQVTMDDLQIGQSVLLANKEMSSVFAFSHSDSNIFSTFYHFVTPAGNLTVTKGHYIYAKPSSSSASNMYLAQDVKVGHFLERGDNLMVPVLNVKIVREQGLFNPHTFSGELLVDGFRVSSFTKAVHPMMASSLLAPVRALFRLARFDMMSSSFSQGCPAFLKQFPSTYYM